MNKFPELMAGVGVLALSLVPRLHHLIVNPHLTEMQAFRVYWPFWIAVPVVMLAYFVVRRRTA